MVDTVLRGCPEARFLVTSREALGVVGEMVFRVPSLAVPPVELTVTATDLGDFAAARLFLDRVHRVRPTLIVDDLAARDVAAICSRLDGIPLALELAAARAGSMPLERVAVELDDVFRLLTGGSRTALARQQTLQASIAWSVDLLDDVERSVLCRLATFRGSFTLAAAEAIATDEALVDRFVVLDSVGRLVDKNLVQLNDDTGRYRLLETIRQFALDELRRTGDVAPTAADTAAGSPSVPWRSGASPGSGARRATRTSTTSSLRWSGRTTTTPPRPTASLVDSAGTATSSAIWLSSAASTTG